jgi:hypothetical protein
MPTTIATMVRILSGLLEDDAVDVELEPARGRKGRA